MIRLAYIAAIAAICGACACSGPKGWKVAGNVANAPEGAKIAVEGFNGARWYCIDSVDVEPDGSFSFAAVESSPYPDVYRLGLDGKSIYFPIDSLDAVSVNADAAHFESGYTLSGTPMAEAMFVIDNEIAAYKAKNPGAMAVDSIFKRRLNEIILNDSSGLISYYLINKTIGGKPIYDPANRRDLAMIGALANKFEMMMPSDPRTGVLKQRYLQGRADAGTMPVYSSTIEANEVSLFEVELFDNKGVKRSLAECAKSAPVVVLSFTAYDLETSPAYNVMLNSVYDKYRNAGLEIYQIGLDADEVEWHASAANLPWITVHSMPSDAQQLIATYNVGALPMTYIIKNGSLEERVIDPNDIMGAVAKYM